MEPKSLLFRNQFISPNTYTKKKEFDELQKFIKETFKTDPLQDELDDFESDEEDNFDLLEPPINQPELTSSLNRSQWLPQSLSEGPMPILSKTLNDITKIKYRKQIVSYINIDSKRRDFIKYPNPGNYRIFLNNEFRNIFSIRLEDIIFKNPPTPINSSNNTIIWTTNYSQIDVPNLFVQYTTTIPPAYYSLDSFVQAIETSLNSIQHQIPSGGYPNNIFPSFRIEINPYSRSIKFIQRLQELTVNSISTTNQTNTVRIRVADPAGTASPPFLLVGGIPIIITGFNKFGTNMGGIPVTFLDFQPFYPNAPSGNSFVYFGYDAVNNEFIYDLTVFDSEGNDADANQTTLIDLTSTNFQTPTSGHPIAVLAGRALSFTLDDCSSFVQFLGLQDATEDILIHTNMNNGNVINIVPWYISGNGDLLLAGDDYILMRIEPNNKPLGTISSNLISALGKVTNENFTRDNYFAKIIFANSIPGDTVTRAVCGDKIFYEAPLVKLNYLDISFYGSNGNLLELVQNHSFDLQIVEVQEVLKDTLIDSRTGAIADFGAGMVMTNPLD